MMYSGTRTTLSVRYRYSPNVSPIAPFTRLALCGCREARSRGLGAPIYSMARTRRPNPTAIISLYLPRRALAGRSTRGRWEVRRTMFAPTATTSRRAIVLDRRAAQEPHRVCAR